MSDVPIHEPPSELESASVGQRIAAQVLDIMAVLFFLPMAMALIPAHSAVGLTMRYVLLIGGVAYRLIGDGVMEGACLGKRLVGIYVVDAQTRQPCSIGQAAIRMGILHLPLAQAIEPVILACDGQRRWGDTIARTYVLRRKPKPTPVVPVARPLKLDGLKETLEKLKGRTD